MGRRVAKIGWARDVRDQCSSRIMPQSRKQIQKTISSDLVRMISNVPAGKMQDTSQSSAEDCNWRSAGQRNAQKPSEASGKFLGCGPSLAVAQAPGMWKRQDVRTSLSISQHTSPITSYYYVADHWVICPDMSRNVRRLSMFQSRALNEIRSRLSLAALLQALLNLHNSTNLQPTSTTKILHYCVNTTNATKFRKKTTSSLNKGTADCSDFALSWGKIQDSG